MMPNDLRAALEAGLPPERLNRLRQVQRAAAEAGLPTYLAGGFVRDLLLGLPPGDFDFVVEAPEGPPSAPRLARALGRAYGGQVITHAPFGTATWVDTEGAALDFATTRTETYPQPGALPVVTPATSIHDDLRRRDFTLNAIALRVDGDHYGALVDPLNGRADIAARCVRVLHPGSFQDDPTRIFRGVRYEQRLGFSLDPQTLALVPAALAIISALSGERVRYELELIGREPKSSAMLARLDALGVLAAVHPALRWSAAAVARAELAAQLPRAGWRLAQPVDPLVIVLALLLADAAPEAAELALSRLSLTRAAFDAVIAAVALRLSGSRPSEVAEQLDGLSEAALVAAYVLFPEARDRLDAYVSKWRFVRSEVTGDDLVALGLEPGPQFKHILRRLRAARLDGDVTDRAGEVELALRLTRQE